MPDPVPSSLRILILTDGKIGDLIQCRGVAARLAEAQQIEERVVEPDWFHALPLPFIPVQKKDRPGQPGSPFPDTLPDLVLASGRRTIPYLRSLRQMRGHNSRPLIVFLKDPRMGRRHADFVWAPVHDQLSGKGAISTHTSPHTLSAKALAQAAASAKTRFADRATPRFGLILGGDSGSVKWDSAMASDLVSQLELIPSDTGIIATPSRRTPDVLMDAVQSFIDKRSGWLWNRSGINPYAEILSHADTLIVTGDSHNMVSECLASGRPVFVYRPKGLQPKLHRFLDAMEAQGSVRPLSGGLVDFEPTKLDATQEIAEAIGNQLNR